MRKKAYLITGASGEIGQALVKSLPEQHEMPIITLDIAPIPEDIQPMVTSFQGDIMDRALLSRLVSEYEVDTIYHLAALLSTRSEFTPEAAHKVNVEGTLGLLNLAAEQSEWRDVPVKFIFPSSIAAYGLPDLETKTTYSRVREWEWNNPRTMYGCNYHIFLNGRPPRQIKGRYRNGLSRSVFCPQFILLLQLIVTYQSSQ